MVESDAAPLEPPAPPRWRLRPGVGLLAGTSVGGARPSEPACLLVTPGGRRYAVSEPLYRLAELLTVPRAADEIAARLGARLGRTIGADDVERLIRTRLVEPGLAVETAAGPDAHAV